LSHLFLLFFSQRCVLADVKCHLGATITLTNVSCLPTKPAAACLCPHTTMPSVGCNTTNLTHCVD
jgi:hypothetical protein